ncbi:hypothetical protein BJ875DRAFT_485909 [Amylocarpus encephaloides]|uniref:Uncharacterized protein n=1 Tax=Amylocarpus encephaloides TaxID=45428 RepID=A0A9P8C3L5_9HELO|nr:hypothetical protein BJ875DRAFT_485909 [Amylocarpus encephaloides]
MASEIYRWLDGVQTSTNQHPNRRDISNRGDTMKSRTTEVLSTSRHGEKVHRPSPTKYPEYEPRGLVALIPDQKLDRKTNNPSRPMGRASPSVYRPSKPRTRMQYSATPKYSPTTANNKASPLPSSDNNTRGLVASIPDPKLDRKQNNASPSRGRMSRRGSGREKPRVGVQYLSSHEEDRRRSAKYLPPHILARAFERYRKAHPDSEVCNMEGLDVHHPEIAGKYKEEARALIREEWKSWRSSELSKRGGLRNFCFRMNHPAWDWENDEKYILTACQVC